MLNYNDTLIIFGRSTFINEIADSIPDLCKKYHTMGCNYFVNSFPQVEYVIFYDDLVPNVQPQHRIITNIKYSKDTNSKSYNLLNTHGNCELYNVNKDFKFSTKPDTLHMCIHTPSIGMNWAYLKGFKNIVLAGIDLNSNNQHFDYKTTPDQNGHTLCNKALPTARRHLKEVAIKVLNVYQLNPNSNLDLPKIKLSDLL